MQCIVFARDFQIIITTLAALNSNILYREASFIFSYGQLACADLKLDQFLVFKNNQTQKNWLFKILFLKSTQQQEHYVVFT